MVVVSGQAGAADVAREIGADAFVPKPFDPVQILEVVRRLAAPVRS